jgi:triosephosphate isomerase (TIM)
MMRRPVFAGNWKMNQGPTQARAFTAAFLAAYTPRADRTVILIPPAVSLTTVRDALGSRKDVQLGAQNVHTEERGAFTGETSAAMARDAGAAFALVGHSERRHVFGETDAQTAKKCETATNGGLVPILCVGEKLEQREAGDTEGVVLRQLEAGLANLSVEQVARVLIAYEPVWAIGTGKTATPNDASTVHGRIRAWLRERIGEPAEHVPVLYGGSVTKANAAQLLGAANVDGLLVGGASLEVEGWTVICHT